MDDIKTEHIYINPAWQDWAWKRIKNELPIRTTISIDNDNFIFKHQWQNALTKQDIEEVMNLYGIEELIIIPAPAKDPEWWLVYTLDKI